MPREKDEGTGGSVVLTVVLIAVIVVLIGVLLYVLSVSGVELPFMQGVRNGKFEQALDEHNYQAAYTVYDASTDKAVEEALVTEHLNDYFETCLSGDYTAEVWMQYRGIEVFNALITEDVYIKLDEIVKRYYAGEYTEDEAKTYLSRVGKFSFVKEELTDAVNEVKSKNASDNAYKDGVELYNNGEFEQAVTRLKKVSQNDMTRYELAQDAIERIKREWGKSKLDEAQAMIEAYNKEGARALLEELMELFGGFDEAEQMLETLEPVLEG